MKSSLVILSIFLLTSYAGAEAAKKQDRTPANGMPPGARGMPARNPETCKDTTVDELANVIEMCDGTWHATGKGKEVSLCCRELQFQAR